MEITFRAIIEVLGKPKEHVDQSLKSYVEKLKEEKKFQVLQEEIAEIKKQDDSELWAAFAELEVKTGKIDHLTYFCFEYMPSLLEIISPKNITFTDGDLTHFINDLQIKLHQVDMVAKEVKMELDIYKKSLNALLKNYITLVLGNRKLTSQQLSNLTGVDKDKLEDFLDLLIDQGKIDLEDDKYFLVAKNEQ